MPLTTGQLQTLKAHILANTNTVMGVPINALPNDSDANFAVAQWYNQTALAGDDQPFAAPLELWKPLVTITELNTAVNWSQDPAGATDAARTNSWLRWQSMCWSNSLDLTDNQVRSGVAAVWATGSTNGAIKAVGVGRRVGTRFERLFAGASRGPNGAAAGVDVSLNGRVSPVFGQQLSAGDVNSALNLP